MKADVQGILRVFQLAQDALPERNCTGRACCCQFAVTGREPFVTVMEMDVIIQELARQGRRVPAARKDNGCPLLSADGMRCTIYEARPLGCRTFFCREAGGVATARDMRDAVHALNALDEARGKKRGGSRTLTAALKDAR